MKKSNNHHHQQEKQPLEFTNSAGETFSLLPMNPLEQNIIRKQIEDDARARGGKLERPVYQAANAAGEMMKMELRRREDANTPELQQEWDLYEKTLREVDAEFSSRYLTSVYLCVQGEVSEYPAWKKRMLALGIKLPEDELELWKVFCETWVIRSKEDLTNLIFTLTATVSGVSPEARAAAEEMFRRSVEEAYQHAVNKGEAG